MSKNVSANTPVMKQFIDVKSKYKDAIVLFRMGDFYETFLEDAKITSKILGIVLTKRANGKAADVELAGFPYHALDNYLPKLVKAGHRVAICEQVEDPKLAKGIVKREVLEVVTPGTLTGDQTLNSKSNRYIGSLCIDGDKAGFAYLDSSTGEFNIGECGTDQLSNSLLKFLPHEVVLSQKIVYSNSKWYLEFQPFITQIEDWMFDHETAYRILISHFNVKSLKGFGCEDMFIGISAAGALMNHIKSNLVSSLEHISKISPVISDGFMGLDSFTIKNLEVFQSLSSQGTHGTLIDSIDSTITAGGGRHLRRCLMNPLTDIKKIRSRLNIVEGFTHNKTTLKTIKDLLSRTSDIQRILGKIGRGKASPRDVFALSETLENIPKWKKALCSSNNNYLDILSDSFNDTSHIVKEIKNVINNTPPVQLSQGGVIKSGVDKDLDELRMLLKNGREWIDTFQSTMREELDIPKLKIGFNKIFGYYIEITKVHQDKVPESFIRKQTLVNSERYITEELKEYEEKVLNAEEKIYEIESRIFSEICQLILSYISDIQNNASAINELDLYSSFASLAINNHYVKPSLSMKPLLNIKDGRHPVVEQLLPATEKFIPNNITMDASKNQIHLLTGPNMAGKSTYLRQIGLISLMAQIGSFVPAKSASIGIVDRLFTRVGASDNLAGGESTFLVEMNEAANILNNATDNSLILLDEVGRGTSTYDGLSLAWAITEYLHNTDGIRARTIFATHYHELTDLENTLERLENHHVEVKEFGESIIFLRSIARGAGDKSYGIHVAKMAGLPSSIILRASEILDYHIQQSLKDGSHHPSEVSNQLTFFQERESKLREQINKVDLNSMTPLEALAYLNELKKEYDQ